MENGRQRILVIGQSPSLLEGMRDLLQLAGYQVDISSGWAEAEYARRVTLPNLIVIDLSTAALELSGLPDQIGRTPRWSKVPLLFVSFSGDERIREVQRRSENGGNGRLHFYAHTVLSIEGLLAQVQACLN